MMFHLNEFWYGQWYYLAATHEVVEIVYEAAILSLGDNHLVLAISSSADTSHFSALAFFSEPKFEFRVAASLKYYL